MDDIAGQLETVAAALLRGDHQTARRLFCEVDQQRLVHQRVTEYARIWGPNGIASRARPHQPGIPRTPVGQALKRKIFERDQFTCRYSHCQRRTIVPSLILAFSKAFPDLQPYDGNWTPRDAHIILWTHAVSLEHHVAFAHGGASLEENLITACYHCNDLKNRLNADDLGWTASPPASVAWDGLSAAAKALKRAGFK